jgi:acetyl-CoA C-acetyltransferase
VRRIVISGYGITDFGRAEGKTIVDLAEAAAREALAAANASAPEMEALYLGTFSSAVLGGQNFPAAVLAQRLGLVGIPALAVEGACASGSVAVRQAINLIRAGEAEAVLVVGAEKMTASETPIVTAALAAANDTSSGGYRAGLTFPGFFALLATAYLDRYGVEREALADVTVKNRRNGAANQHAQFRSEVTAEQVLDSRPIADPLRLFDCSPISDGAAALVVSTPEWADGRGETPIEVLASEQASGPTAAETIDDFTSLSAAVAAARRAYERAGVKPEDVSVAEVHDCFSIAEWVALEDLGLVARGQAPEATAAGETAIGGRIPVNPSGGLISKGHPIGATGVGQLIELVRQLRGEADNQVAGASLGLAHNVGGTGGLGSVTLLARAA